MTRRLEGLAALVTGGASGVGRATALRFAAEGVAAVTLFDLDADRLQRVGEEVSAHGAKAIAVAGNVTSLDDCQRAVQAARAPTGRLDILVSNAGADLTVPFLELSLDEWRRVIEVNLTASFVLGQLAAREMVRSGLGGSILYTASISGVAASQGDAHYGVSKAGIISLVKTMAIELVDKGIRVNAVSPGPLDTPLSLALLGSEEALDRARNHWPMVPMNRLGKAEEIAAAYAYLASADGAYTTGQNLIIDGGLTTNVYPLADELAHE
jgi:NAD(P)-dependent dehydrogenase (short-subunit alcohol dehydrogenase family)